MKISERLRLMPLLVVVALLCFSVRMGEFVMGFGSMGHALAQQEVSEGEDISPPPLPKTDGPKTDGANASEDNNQAQEAIPGDVDLPNMNKSEGEGKATESVDWKDAGEEDFNYSGVQEDLYRDLVSRREELDKREKILATRQALLEAAERELDQKVRELTVLRAQIEGLLAKQSEEEVARTQSLVRIYEGMKAKDAARIFNTLDTDVLLQVLTSMSERKSSPILAEMDAERARTITMLMAQQQSMPLLPPQ